MANKSKRKGKPAVRSSDIVSPLSWKFRQRIGDRDFIIYENGRCRIDDGKEFKTYYYENGTRLQWWKQYEKAVGKPKGLALQRAIDHAWMAFIGWLCRRPKRKPIGKHSGYGIDN